jgi:hypothetical protein
MKTNSLTHAAISKRAQEIWLAEDKPSGRDLEIWLSAEQQLSAPVAEAHPSSASRPKNDTDFRTADDSPVTADRIKSETAAESVVEYNISPAIPEADAVQAALQTPASRGVKPAITTTPQDAAKAQQQKKAARAPQLPGKTAPKAAPAESGKPLWDKPHSS